MKTTEDRNNIFLTQEFKDRGQIKSLKKGETLFRKGEMSNCFYYVLSGLLDLVDVSSNGTESLLRVYGQNSFLGYRSFIAQEECHASSEALTDVTYLQFDFATPKELLDSFSDIYVHLSKILCQDLKLAEERINDISGKRVLNRIIETLIYLKQKDPHYVWTRREIGEFCSATTETVTRTLSKLEKLELIGKEGRDIIIHDTEKLLDYSKSIEVDV